MSQANTTEANRPKCTATRRDGRPCEALALPGEALCFSHSPATQAQREAARARGGHNSSKAARLTRLIPERLLPTFQALQLALTDVLAGKLDTRRAVAAAAVARAMVAVLQAGELEERLRRLEEKTGDEH